MTRNKAISETQLLRATIDGLRDRLPPSWDIHFFPGASDTIVRPDAVIEVRDPDGVSAPLVVEVKSELRPNNVPNLLQQLRRYTQSGRICQPFVVSSFLGPETREQLKKAGAAGYADATGNFRLTLDKPAVFIETIGAERNPWPEPSALRSLRGRGSGRAMRALCDFRPPYGVRELAERSKTPAPTLSRVIEFLEHEGIVHRKAPRGPIVEVNWQALLHRWAQDYTFTGSNRTALYMEPRGLPALLDKLRSTPVRYAVTGSLAAADVAPVAASNLVTVYTPDEAYFAEKLSLRRTATGSNVMLAEPFDRVVFERHITRHDVVFAACSQVAVDLLTGPGRSPVEGEALIEWMRRHEDVWRL